jgi:hypothetical protein
MDEPPIKLAIRKGKDELEWRHEQEWPLKRTQWTKFYFDLSKQQARDKPQTGTLATKNPATESSCTYPAFSLGTMGSTSAASSQVMGGGGHCAGNLATACRHRSHRPADGEYLGIERNRGHGPVPHAAQLRRRGE